MAMKWLENELRQSDFPGDQKRADTIKTTLEDRGEDISLPHGIYLPPIYSEEPLITERNTVGYLNLTAALLRIKPRAPYHQSLRERLNEIARNPQEFDQLASNLESIIESLPLQRERQVLIARQALQGQGSLPEPAVPLAERFGVSPGRILDIEKAALRRLRHASRLGKIKPFFSGI